MNTQPTKIATPKEQVQAQEHHIIALDKRVYSVLIRNNHVHPNQAVLLGTEAIKQR